MNAGTPKSILPQAAATNVRATVDYMCMHYLYKTTACDYVTMRAAKWNHSRERN